MEVRNLPRLEIGAGETAKREGWLNCDIHPGPNIQAVFDAQGEWPFDSNSIHSVHANHVLEHLQDPFAFMREAWRVLAPSGVANLYLRLPYGPSEAGFGDLTHVRYYTPTAFSCFQPGYGASIRNPQYRDREVSFEVVQIYQRIDQRLRWLVKPVIRRWGLRIIPFLWGGYWELIVGMRALKNGERVKVPNNVPVANCMYKHEYEGRPAKDGEPWKLLFFFDDGKVEEQ